MVPQLIELTDSSVFVFFKLLLTVFLIQGDNHVGVGDINYKAFTEGFILN